MSNAFTIPGVTSEGWADEQQAAPQEIDAASLVIDDVTVEQDADQIEADAKDREFHPLPVGHHTVTVVGFGKVTKDTKTVFLAHQKGPDGKPLRHTFTATNVTVRFAHPQHKQYQVSDVFTLPPSDPTDLVAYNYGSTQENGSTAGFYAEKFAHFINRLIGGFAKGQKLPPAARELKNWVGRQIELDVVISKAREGNKIDPKTGKKVVYEARPQVKLYSYRACGTAGSPSDSLQAPASPSAPAAPASPTAPTPPAPAAPANLPRGARNI